MDDLDHSMHIAEYDWTSFYEDSEECCLLQPSLVYPDNLSLSDSEDSENPSSVCSTGQGDLQPSLTANSDEAESNAAGCCMEEVQINQNHSGGEQDELTTKAEEDSDRWVKSDMCIDYPEGNTITTEEAHMRNAEQIPTTLQTEQLYVQASDGESTELERGDRDTQAESDASSIHEPDPLSGSHTELHVNELHTADRAASENVSSLYLRDQNERWFVTVNDSPARRRVRATSVKKKRRQKKPCKNSHAGQISVHEISDETDLELEINKVDDKSEGGRVTERVTESNQNSREYPSSESNQMGYISNLSQMFLTSGEEDNLSDKLIAAHTTDPAMDRDKHDPSSSRSTSKDRFSLKNPPRLDSVESDELEDAVEFHSVNSYDSEYYLSATESVEEPQPPLMENQQSLIRNSFLFSLTGNTDADNTQDREMHSCQSALSYYATATNSQDYESSDVEPALTFPSAAQSVNKMADDTSTCDNDTHSTQLCGPSETPELQKHEINLSASGCSSGDRHSPPPTPDVTLTPCFVADSPETYAEAAGHTRPVYAISAFWDEMEKLTINDILQLRMSRSPPPRDTQETGTPNVGDFSTNHRSLVDTVEYNLSDGSPIDISDTADSDYFTQADESKPDRSSCEFSTSDFEEEYWQFLGSSRNPSPDPQSKIQQRTSDSPSFAQEEEEFSSSEGKETPVPSEELAGQSFEEQDSIAFISSKLGWPRQMTKSKSVKNIQALNTEDMSLQLSLGDDKSSLFLCSCPSVDEDVVLKASDSLGTLTPAPFPSDADAMDEPAQIFSPEVFDYIFMEDKAKRNCVTVYDPEDISLAPGFDYALCTLRDETSFFSLCDSQRAEEKPIPIFTCSHPTVRELTMPNPDYVYLTADCEKDDISPIRVVSHSFILGGNCGTSTATPRGVWSWSFRKIRFCDKGSIWCRGSGAWVFPFDCEKITMKKVDPAITLLNKGGMSPSQLCEELTVQQRLLETMQTTSKSKLS